MTESKTLEFKESLNPENLHDRLKLVREIVGMANTNGGRIRIGVADDGTVVGVEGDEADKWDPATIGDLLDRFLNPDHLEIDLRLTSDGCPEGRVVVDVIVPKAANPPLVLCRDGNHGNGAQLVFHKNAVLVRHNTKVETARRSDYLRWREDQRNRILQQFQMVVAAPESAQLRMVDSGEVRDEPSYFLSRSVDLFRQRREKLLDGDDLLYLFVNRDALDLTNSDACELLVQSGLRRRATLFFWLALCSCTAAGVADVLTSALSMSDRDKSDMAGVVPLVAALYLTADEYADLIERMEASSYAHIRQAAVEFSDLRAASRAIDERRAGMVDGRALSDFGDDELLAEASALAVSGGRSRVSRRMPNLGLELLTRRLEGAA